MRLEHCIWTSEDSRKHHLWINLISNISWTSQTRLPNTFSRSLERKKVLLSKHIRIHKHIWIPINADYSGPCQLHSESAQYLILIIEVIFLMFDLDASENLSLDEIISVFISCINGYAKFSNQTPPEHMNVIYYAKIMFLKSDV